MNRRNETRHRDREETARIILVAALEVLADGGHTEFGVNAIARRAGCDKQLIYRYYGGLEGLADAIGVHLASELAARLEGLGETPKPTTYAELMRVLVVRLLDLLRDDRIMQRIIAWEIAAPSPLSERMVAARGKGLAIWMRKMRAGLADPEGVDAPALNAVLIASTQHLVLSSAAQGVFAGMSLKSEADWKRVRTALVTFVDAVYGAKPPRA